MGLIGQLTGTVPPEFGGVVPIGATMTRLTPTIGGAVIPVVNSTSTCLRLAGFTEALLAVVGRDAVVAWYWNPAGFAAVRSTGDEKVTLPVSDDAPPVKATVPAGGFAPGTVTKAVPLDAAVATTADTALLIRSAIRPWLDGSVGASVNVIVVPLSVTVGVAPTV